EGLAFDAGLECYAFSDRKGNISVRRIADDQELARLPGEGLVARCIRFSPKGDRLIVRYNPPPGKSPFKARVWDWRRGQTVAQPPFDLEWTVMEYSPDHRYLALGQPDGTLSIHHAANGEEVQRMTLGFRPSALAYQADGTRLVAASAQ